ncbi:unnamed protein product [Sphagnum balticum]
MFGKDFPKLNLLREAEANEREDQKTRQNEGEKCNIDNILEARGDMKENNSVIAPTRQQDYRPAASDLRNNSVAESSCPGSSKAYRKRKARRKEGAAAILVPEWKVECNLSNSPFTRGEPHVGTITVGHRGGMGGFSHEGGLGFDSLACGADQPWARVDSSVPSVDQAVGIWVRDCPGVKIRLEGSYKLKTRSSAKSSMNVRAQRTSEKRLHNLTTTRLGGSANCELPSRVALPSWVLVKLILVNC